MGFNTFYLLPVFGLFGFYVYIYIYMYMYMYISIIVFPRNPWYEIPCPNTETLRLYGWSSLTWGICFHLLRWYNWSTRAASNLHFPIGSMVLVYMPTFGVY